MKFDESDARAAIDGLSDRSADAYEPSRRSRTRFEFEGRAHEFESISYEVVNLWKLLVNIGEPVAVPRKRLVARSKAMVEQIAAFQYEADGELGRNSLRVGHLDLAIGRLKEVIAESESVE